MTDNIPLPENVIASSNRFSDIAPFSAYLFKSNPRLWGSVFPWDFPQQAPREVEEDFLRRFFDETTIYMQGGAGAPGHGFRFLKQVWYTCALWNLEHRVPAVEKWYWEQAGNAELLNDPSIKTFFFREDIQPSTFFKQAELDMYGNKFLTVVANAIQNTARQHDAKKKEDKQRKDSPAVSIPPKTTVSGDVNDSIVKSAPPAQQEHKSPSEAEFPVTSRRATLGSVDGPQIAPVPTPTTTEPAPVKAANTPQAPPPVPHGMPQQHSRKRGNSMSRRHNNRGGHFNTRPHHAFTERDGNAQQTFSPQLYGPPMAQGMPRGAAPDFMPGMPQGPPSHFQYVPGQYGQPGIFAPHNMMHANSYGPPQPIYFPNGTFPDHNNGRFAERDFNTDSRSFSNDNSTTNRGGRRPSQGQGPRGGKSRGVNSLRGRGGRGRDSFNSSDGRPAFMQGFQHEQKQSNDHAGPGISNFRPRRGSIASNNWRSTSDHPQAVPLDPDTKENVPPFQQPGYRFPPNGPPQHDFPSQTAYQPDPSMMKPFPPMRPEVVASNIVASQNRWAPTGNIPSQASGIECNRFGFDIRCTHINKLVLFNVPDAMSDEQIKEVLSDWAPVQSVSRKPLNTSYPGPDRNNRLTWLYFADHVVARQMLDNKPAYWLDGQPLRIEVPREYWDPAHNRYRDPSTGVVSLPGAFRGPPKNVESSQVPSILRREEQRVSAIDTTTEVAHVGEERQSTETTPTPSGASTPKRKTKSGKKKNKAADLRKASFAALADLKQAADPRGETSGTSIVAGNVNSAPTIQPEETGLVNTPGDHLSTATQNERSWSVQIEVQTSQEPPFTPTEDLQTRLPDVGDAAIATTNEPGQAPSVTAVEIPTEQPASQRETLQPFREDKAPEVATQTEDLGGNSGHQFNESSPLPSAPAETPAKANEDLVDDSFHTASGSPDSAMHEGAGEGAVTDLTTSQVPAQQTEDLPARGSEPVPPEQSAAVSSSDEAISPKTIKRVPVPQVSSKPKVTISTAEPGVKTEKSEQRSTSGSTMAPPTPAFVTAPTTPAVNQEPAIEEEASETEAKPVATSMKTVENVELAENAKEAEEFDKLEKVDEAEKSEKPEKSEKAEKPKGPAQTQSFSLYGRKNEKKSKPNKKGTLKGKPASGAASESSSRAVSGATTPSIDTATQGGRSRRASKQDGEAMARTQSKGSTDEGGERKAKQETKKVTKDDAPAPQQETPSKRGKLGNLLSGIFGGGQHSQPASSKTRSDSTASSKNWLTKSKAPDLPPSIDTQLNEARPSGTSDIDKTEHMIASQETASKRLILADIDTAPVQVDASGTVGILPTVDPEHDPESALCLGISNITAEQSVQSGTGTKKKKKAKKRKSSSAANELQINTEFSPEVKHEKLQEVFRFEEGSSPQAPTHGDDQHSNASSQTMGADTPSSEVPSPQSVRKPLPRPTGSSHLMEAKEPVWKQKKRVLSRTIHDISVDSNPDEEAADVGDDADTSEKKAPADEGRSGSPHRERIFVYVGAPLRDEVEDGPEVEQSREKLQRLAIEEIRRKHRNT